MAQLAAYSARESFQVTGGAENSARSVLCRSTRRVCWSAGPVWGPVGRGVGVEDPVLEAEDTVLEAEMLLEVEATSAEVELVGEVTLATSLAVTVVALAENEDVGAAEFSETEVALAEVVTLAEGSTMVALVEVGSGVVDELNTEDTADTREDTADELAEADDVGSTVVQLAEADEVGSTVVQLDEVGRTEVALADVGTTVVELVVELALVEFVVELSVTATPDGAAANRYEPDCEGSWFSSGSARSEALLCVTGTCTALPLAAGAEATAEPLLIGAATADDDAATDGTAAVDLRAQRLPLRWRGAAETGATRARRTVARTSTRVMLGSLGESGGEVEVVVVVDGGQWS